MRISRRGFAQRAHRQLGRKARPGLPPGEAVPLADARHALFVGRAHQPDGVAVFFEGRAHDDRAVHEEERLSPAFRLIGGGQQAGDDLRVGDAHQLLSARFVPEGPVRQQLPVYRTLGGEQIITEGLRQFCKAGRAGLQHLPGHQVGIRHGVAQPAVECGDGAFAAARTAGDADDLHSSTTSKAAARTSRL